MRSTNELSIHRNLKTVLFIPVIFIIFTITNHNSASPFICFTKSRYIMVCFVYFSAISDAQGVLKMITHIIRSQRRLSESLLKFSRTCSTVGSVQRQAKRSLYVHNKQLLLSHSNPNFTPSRAHVPRHFASKPSSAYQHQSAVGFVDYEQERANFRLTVPEYYNFATDVIDDWAKKEKVMVDEWWLLVFFLALNFQCRI